MTSLVRNEKNEGHLNLPCHYLVSTSTLVYNTFVMLKGVLDRQKISKGQPKKN
jgi:hypothetical protein